jgi:hypothetical protein
MKWLLLFPIFLFSQYAFIEKHNGSQIKKIQIFGEMHSGTNYLEMLLLKNLSGVTVFSGQKESERPFGQKHFPAWFDHPLSYHKSLGLDERYWNFSDSSDTLFIVIVRDPYDWIRALYKRPFHIASAKPFQKFIRRNVRFKVSKDLVNTIDFNPETRDFFVDPLVFRSAKLTNAFNLKERVGNCFFINYEALRDMPNEVLKELSTLFAIEKRQGFTPVTTYKSQSVAYSGSRYFPIPKKDLSYINKRLDWNIEGRMGYQKKNHVD